MAEPFPVSGNIDPNVFPNLLVDLHRQGATGSLKINGPIHPKALYFRGGRILFGSSNDPRDQLGAILIESGRITREQLDEVNAKVGPGNPLAKVLAESGFVNQRELGDAARDKVERILSDVLSWESGTFEFEDGVLPKGAVDLKLSTGKLLLAAIQRISDRAFALRHLGGDMTVVLAPVSEAEDNLSDVRAEVWPLLERLDGQRTLQDAVALTRFDEFEAAKIACAMLFLGIVTRQEAGDELDLAEQAQSGLADGPVAAVLPDADLGPAPVVVPDAEPLSAEPLPEMPQVPPATSEPEPMAAAPVFPEAGPAPESFEIPEPEPVEAEPLAAPEPPPPVPVAEPEPPLVAPLPEPVPPTPGQGETSTGFAFVESEEPQTVTPSIPTPEPTVALPPDAPSGPEGFAVEPPPRKDTDTVPGDRQVYSPPAPGGEATVAVEIPEPPPPTARPSKEDLAALDALLNPDDGSPAAPAERPRAEKWEPQFRPGTTPPGRRVVGRRGGESRNRLYAALGGVAVIVIGAAAAAYMFLGGPPEPTPAAVPTPSPETAPTPAPPPPTTMAAVPAPDPAPGGTTTDPSVEPPPADVPPATEPAAGATAVPPPVPAPTPPSPVAPAPAGDALALLRQGDLDGSARQSAATLAAGPAGRYGIQALVACSPETVHKAVRAVPGEQLFILPVNYRGRDCHRICWGVFDDLATAEVAARSFPDYFRQNGISPRIQPIAELLP